MSGFQGMVCLYFLGIPLQELLFVAMGPILGFLVVCIFIVSVCLVCIQCSKKKNAGVYVQLSLSFSPFHLIGMCDTCIALLRNPLHIHS